MAVNKKLSITAIDRAIKEEYVNDVVCNFYGSEFIVHRFISLESMIKFVNEVTEGCFDGDSGKYLPEIRDLITKRSLLYYYADVNIPSDYSHLYEIIYKTDLLDIIYRNIDQAQYKDILDAIDAKIDERIYTNEQKFNSSIESAISSINSMAEQLESIFKDVTPEDMLSIISAVSNGVDEAKLVDAVIAKGATEDGEDNTV